MRPLDYLWTPTLVFVVVYLILMKENNLLALEIRYRLSVICGWLFLIGPLFSPVTMSSIGRIHDNLLITAWYAGSFGLALTAVRLRASRPAAAFLLLIVSGVTLGVMLYDLFSRAYIR